MYALLSVFPALAAAVSFYGLLFSPADVIKQMNAFSDVLPPGVWDIFNNELQDVARHQTGTLTIAATLALLVALASARSGMASLMQAANIAYQEREKRGGEEVPMGQRGAYVADTVGPSAPEMAQAKAGTPAAPASAGR
jgi:membrane protein